MLKAEVVRLAGKIVFVKKRNISISLHSIFVSLNLMIFVWICTHCMLSIVCFYQDQCLQLMTLRGIWEDWRRLQPVWASLCPAYMTHSDNTLMTVYLWLYIGDHTYISDGVMVIISSLPSIHDPKRSYFDDRVSVITYWRSVLVIPPKYALEFMNY